MALMFTQVIAARMRHPMHCLEAAKAGVRVATVPFNVLMQITHQPPTGLGVARFTEDWRGVS